MDNISRFFENGGYKPPAIIAVAAVVLVVWLVLLLCGKRRLKSYLITLALGLAVAATLIFTNISTVDDYYSRQSTQGDAIGSVSMTIRCDTIKQLSDYAPANGVILSPAEYQLHEGDTAYSLLVLAAREYKIPIDNKGASAADAYICGINHIYEFDYGELSGWIYRVNGSQPSVGCGSYRLREGDVVEWLYSKNLGKDVN